MLSDILHCEISGNVTHWWRRDEHVIHIASSECRCKPECFVFSNCCVFIHVNKDGRWLCVSHYELEKRMAAK